MSDTESVDVHNQGNAVICHRAGPCGSGSQLPVSDAGWLNDGGHTDEGTDWLHCEIRRPLRGEVASDQLLIRIIRLFLLRLLVHGLVEQIDQIGSVGLLVHRDVRVEACRLDVGMSEHLLDHTQIGAGFEQMGRKTVAQRMHADPFGNTRLATELLENMAGCGQVIRFLLRGTWEQQPLRTFSTPVFPQQLE